MTRLGRSMASGPDRWPVLPYKGLRHLTAADAPLLVGRADDIATCLNILGERRVFLIHGTSGSGKSSFLHAGLLRSLEKGIHSARLLIRAPHAGKGARRLDRSELNRPAEAEILRSGSRPLEAAANGLLTLTRQLIAGLPKKQRDKAQKLILHGDRWKNLEHKLGNSGAEFVHFAKQLSALSTVSFTIVLDQSEEMFKTNGALEDEENFRAFAEVLRLCTTEAKDIPVRFIISMRTEQKGVLEDELAGRRVPLNALGRFLLPPLLDDDLMKAALRPTCPTPVKGFEYLPPPLEHYQFAFDVLAVEELIRKVAGHGPLEAPPGGALLNLQVACSMLWRNVSSATARRSPGGKRRTNSHSFAIRPVHIHELGNPQDYVDRFIERGLTEALSRTKRTESRSGEALSKCRSVLWSYIEKSHDGRMRSRSFTESNIVDSFADALQAGSRAAQRIVRGLESETIGLITAPEQASTNRSDRRWTLAHDAVGLALKEWNAKQTEAVRVEDLLVEHPVMQGCRFTQWDLYGDTPPPAVSLEFASDPIWDHLLLAFAARIVDDKKVDFFGRLGIRCTQQRFTNEHDYQDIAAWLNEKVHRDTVRIASFPLTFVENASVTSFTPSNTYHGFSLIGGSGWMHGSYAEARTNSERRTWMKRLADELCGNPSRAFGYGSMSCSFIAMIAALGRAARPDIVQSIAKDFRGFVDVEFSPGDVAYEHLRNNEVDFCVGTARTRASATRGGFQALIDLEQLKSFARTSAPNGTKAAWRRRLDELGFLLNTWNVGLSTKHDTDTLLRLTSVLYFATALVEFRPDFLTQFLSEQERGAASKEGDVPLLDSTTIGTAIRHSYRWQTLPVQMRHRTPYHASQTHNQGLELALVSRLWELVLRERMECDALLPVLDHAIEAAMSSRHSRRRSRVNAALVLRDRACRHLQIQNFLDAKRFIAQSIQLLRA